MAFYSVFFLGFVLAFFALHELVGKFKSEYQWIVRLLASITFYVYIAGIRVLFLGVSAFSVWYGAVLITRIHEKGVQRRKAEGVTKDEKKAIKKQTRRNKRIVLWLVIALNIGLLAAVKYILPSVSSSIILPLGISFYTFQAIAYLVDVYGEKYGAQTNFFKILLYLSWFPQLVQGPISRYDFIHQDLYKATRITMRQARYAFYLFLFGCVKRYAVGDVLAASVTRILGGTSVDLPGSYLLFGAFLYAIEQYANFSGGIDMAMAASLMFGVKMADNFKQPYFAKNLAEFWRRWHITLGAWMRDYVFYPFAMLKPVQKLTTLVSNKFGKHAGRAVTGGIGNLIVFALVGIWHGPQLHFLAWGLYNGVIIALSDAFAPAFAKVNTLLHIKKENPIFRLFQIFRTFMIIVFAGYFDIVEGVRLGLQCFRNTFTQFRAADFAEQFLSIYEDGTLGFRAIVVAILGVLVMFIFSLIKEKGTDPIDAICNRKIALRWVICYALIFLFLYSFNVSLGGGFMYAAF